MSPQISSLDLRQADLAELDLVEQGGQGVVDLGEAGCGHDAILERPDTGSVQGVTRFTARRI